MILNVGSYGTIAILIMVAAVMRTWGILPLACDFLCLFNFQRSKEFKPVLIDI